MFTSFNQPKGTEKMNHDTFYGLGIAPKLLQVLDNHKFKIPTPIQYKAIPIAIEGKDVMGIAQTGTGKTLAFAIPMIQQLAQKKGIGLVLVPTRELALQVNETFEKIAQVMGMASAVLIGGASMFEQVQQLKRKPRIIIATPGRLIDHFSQWTVMPEEVSVLVLDEADRMLDMGFQPQIEKILKHIPKERQTMLFSATMPAEILRIASHYMKLPVSVEIAPSGTTVEKVTQELFIVKRDLKIKLLLKLLQQYHGSVLLFSRTKIGARKIARELRKHNVNSAEIHSDRSLSQRREALDGFKSGKYRVLVATDIAARGIDVTGIELVINYDLPEESENYVHRIGRTARAGREGRAISLATPEQREEVRNIEKLLKITLPVGKHPEFPAEAFVAHVPEPRRGGFSSKRRPGGGHHRGQGGQGKFNFRKRR
jgi:ATP-dependent RNA helicase RhlE